MRTINQIIGENLRKIRELSGFTQEQIAKSIGIERSAYSNYEGGTREVPYDILERISNMFGCEPFILFEDNIQADNEIMATAFRISDLEDNDLKEKKQKKEKKSKNLYYTVHLNDIYNSYDDKTVSEDDMIEAIKKETTL